MATIFNFPDETGSRFFRTYILHYSLHRTWKFAVRISKISLLVLKLLAKKRFLAAILNFSHETGSRFIEPIFFTNHYHRTWKSAINIYKMSQLVLELLAKNRISAAILNFPDETGSRFSKPRGVCPNRGPTWTYAVGILKKS